MTTGSRWMLTLAALAALFLASLFTGSVAVPVWDMGHFTDIQKIILFDSRLPRAIAAVLGGASLSLAGLLMQTLFRNPLAGPSVLGITSGSSLAVAVLTMGGVGLFLNNFATVIAAFAGALLVLGIILTVARRFADITGVLIVGLMLSFFTSAIVSFLQSLASENALQAFVFWGFGSFSDISLSQMWYFALPLGLTLVLSPFLIKALNALLLGGLHAQSLGIDVKRTRLIIMLATGVLTGITTAFCGPVAFIGLASPHIARFIFNSADHRLILPSSIAIGGGLALLCDVIARLPGSQYALPLNTVCAFMGAPVVIYLIIAARKRKVLT